MKQTFLILVCGILLSACSTPQEKGEAFAAEYVKKHLFFPDSFNQTDCQVDTAYTPIDSPETIELLKAYAEIIREMNSQNRIIDYKAEALEDAKHDLERMKKYGLADSYYQRSYDKAQEEFDRTNQKLDQLLNRGVEIETKVLGIKQEPKSVLGWKVFISYNAKTNSGMIVPGAVFLIVDSKFEKVIASYDESIISDLQVIQDFQSKYVTQQ